MPPYRRNILVQGLEKARKDMFFETAVNTPFITTKANVVLYS